MSRRKAAQNCAVPWYLSAKPDCKEGRFLQIGNSLFLSPRFIALGTTAQLMYLQMALEAGGKTEFEFPRSAFKKYGIPERSARRAIEELIEAGFITCESGWTIRANNIYHFSFAWKQQKG